MTSGNRENPLYYLVLAVFVLIVAVIGLRSGSPGKPDMPGVKSPEAYVVRAPVADTVAVPVAVPASVPATVPAMDPATATATETAPPQAPPSAAPTPAIEAPAGWELMARRKNSKKLPSILISNDDGIQSHGLQVLARALKKVGHVTVVAPEREQSTMGHSLTLHKPVRLFNIMSEPGMDQWALSGTPADCVYMGIRHVLKKRPDIIVSGINNGVNVGNDLYYSGTVAAAREGAVLEIPAIAASLDYHHQVGQKPTRAFEDAADYMVGLVKEVLQRHLPAHCMLNVNFPNMPFSKIKGAIVSRQGFRIYTDIVREKRDNRKRPYYWLGGTYAGFKPIAGSDCEILDKGYISITPCRLDVTQYEFMDSLERWNLHPKRLAKEGGVKNPPRRRR